MRPALDTRARSTLPSTRHFVRAYGLLYAAFFLLVGVTLPFFPVWLQSRALGPAQIGLILAVTGPVRILLGPAFSALADTTGRPKLVMTALAAAVFCAYGGLSVAHEFWLILILACLGGALHASIMPLVDSTALADANALGLDYGRLRLWGSAAFIAMSFLAGHAITVSGPSSVLVLSLAAIGLLTIAIVTLPSRARPRAATPSRFAAALKALAANRRLLGLILAAGFVQAAHGAYYAFGTLNWQRIGLTPQWIGALWVVGVVFEIALFTHSNRILRRLGPAGLVALGGLAAVVRWGAIACDPPLALLVPLQALHALTFAAVHIGVVQGIHRDAPPEIAATAQALSSLLSGGLLTSAAIIAAGPLYEGAGSKVYLLSAALGLCGGLLAWRVRGAPPDESAR